MSQVQTSESNISKSNLKEATCPNCDGLDLTRIDNYLYNVEYDRSLLGCVDVLRCARCQLAFANPMPSGQALSDYYGKVYRSSGRPHWNLAGKPPEPTHKHFSQLAAISSEVDLAEVRSMFEIGPGAGELGLVLKKAAPNIKLYCSELDSYSLKILSSRGYKNIKTPADLEARAELICSIQCLEHFARINDFFELISSVIAPKGYVFVEVPNCPFGNGFDARPYDSPHLLFFDLASLVDMFTRRGYEIVFAHPHGPILKQALGRAADWQHKYRSWTPERPFVSARDRLRAQLPLAVSSMIGRGIRATRSLSGVENSGWETAIDDYAAGRDSAFNLRVMARRAQ